MIIDLLKDEHDEVRLANHKDLELKYEKMVADALARIQTLHSTANRHASEVAAATDKQAEDKSGPGDTQEQKPHQD